MARHCVIANCSNGSYRLMRWKEKECSIHNDLHGSDVCTCEPPFSLWPIPPRKREPAQRDKWKRLINRIQPGTTNQLLSPSKDQKVCSRHFKDGKPTEANPFPTECLGYPGFERKAARILRFNTEKTNPYTPKITLRNMQRAKPSSDTQSSSSSKATSQTPGTPKEQRQTTTINVSAGKQLRLAQTTFTVEQIELIRRLRNSGLTKKQVVLAFDAFEKVDAELGNVYTSPVSLARPNTLLLRTVSQPSQIQTSDSRGPRLVGPQTTFPVSLQHAVNVPCSTASVPSPQVAATLSTTVHPSSTVTLTSQPPQSVVPPATIRTSGTRGPRLIAPKTTYPVSIRRAVLVPCSATSVLSPQVATTLTTTVQPSGTATLTSPPPQSAVPPVTVTTAATGRVNRRFPVRVVRRVKTEREDSVQDGGGGLVSPEASAVASGGISSVDVDEFLNKGTEKMLEEISEFLLAHPDLAHSDIAEAAGVDLTSVGKFLIGSFSALASLTLQQLCLWFLREHRQQSQQESMQQSQQQEQQQQYSMNTTTMLQSAVQEGAVVTTAFEGTSSVPMDTSLDKSERLNPSGLRTGEQNGLAVNLTPRRERFTFQTQHLEVLEAYFKTKQYPTYDERGDIAQRCNDMMEQFAGRALGEKERMTPQNVAYWFSNRRKDIKRLAREGGIEMANVVLPSKVKHPTSRFTIVDKDTAVLNPMFTPETLPVIGDIPVGVAGTGAFPTSRAPTSGGCETSVDSGIPVSDSAKDSTAVDVTDTADHKPLPFSAASTNVGFGSVVDRIAADITSQLMSMTGSVQTPALLVTAAVKQGQSVCDMEQEQCVSDMDKVI
ncbi:uncharacterized protein LOC143295430 isoform X1 [Babylonia areolata]|uniref:uncharacterized protein LOC143295430 isoform X1 n=1 Tax=Babylonia areolata TaxID=304850 RepID=UPI003FD604AB